MNRSLSCTVLLALSVFFVGALPAQTPGELPVEEVIRIPTQDGYVIATAFFPPGAKLGDEFDVQIRVANPEVATIERGADFRTKVIRAPIDRTRFSVLGRQCGETAYTVSIIDENGMEWRGSGLIQVGLELSTAALTLLPGDSADVTVGRFSSPSTPFARIGGGECYPFIAEILPAAGTTVFRVKAGTVPGSAICTVVIEDDSLTDRITYYKWIDVQILKPEAPVEFPKVGLYTAQNVTLENVSGPPGAFEYQAVGTAPLLLSIEPTPSPNMFYLNLEGMPERVPCSRNQYMLNCTSEYVVASIMGPPGPTNIDLRVRATIGGAMSEERYEGTYSYAADAELIPTTWLQQFDRSQQLVDVLFPNPAGTTVRTRDTIILLRPQIVRAIDSPQQNVPQELVNEVDLPGAGRLRLLLPQNDGPQREFEIETDSGNLVITQEGADSTRPTVPLGGVVEGATFQPGIVSGGWATLLGDFFIENTRSWGDDDFIATPAAAKSRVGQGTLLLPTELDGVSVTVDGKPAFVQFISPNQINFLVDEDETTGPVDVVVTTPTGESFPVIAEKTALRPQLFRFDPEGRVFAAGVHLDGTFLGPAGLFGAAVTTRPAAPGDIVQLFGTGWGPTDPPTPIEQIVTGATPLASPVTVRLGDVEATVQFAGLVGSGLYQINLIIPDLPSGEYVFNAEINGVTLDVPALIAVER